MLDPAVSKKIQKFGVLKWACMDFPHLVFGATCAVIGITIGAWSAFEEVKLNRKAPYLSNYVVVRPGDPRLKYVKVWGPDGKPE